MADNKDVQQSFSTFVKQRKGSMSPPSARDSKNEENEVTSTSAPTDKKAKAQARRAQVRRAQIQHRQRKAEYIKQLEMDINAYRSLIFRAESETVAISRENKLLKDWLALRLPPAPRPMEELEMFGGVDVGVGEGVGNVVVTLAVDETLGVPCFHVTSPEPAKNLAIGIVNPPSQDPVGSTGQQEAPLTPEQEMEAINFILALEHMCWDHFTLGDFPEHTRHREHGNGHALMASTFCMSDAPQSLYEARNAFGPTISEEQLLKYWFKDPDLIPPPERQNPQYTAEQVKANAENCVNPPEPLRWATPQRFSLNTLRGLASSLTSGDLELTPVQAWFELASRYSSEVLLRSDVLNALKLELKGLMRCVCFGTTMERQAFESVVQRVMSQFGF